MNPCAGVNIAASPRILLIVTLFIFSCFSLFLHAPSGSSSYWPSLISLIFRVQSYLSQYFVYFHFSSSFSPDLVYSHFLFFLISSLAFFSFLFLSFPLTVLFLFNFHSSFCLFAFYLFSSISPSCNITFNSPCIPLSLYSFRSPHPCFLFNLPVLPLYSLFSYWALSPLYTPLPSPSLSLSPTDERDSGKLLMKNVQKVTRSKILTLSFIHTYIPHIVTLLSPWM